MSANKSDVEPVENLSAGQSAYRKRIAERKAKRESGFLKDRMVSATDGAVEELIKSEPNAVYEPPEGPSKEGVQKSDEEAPEEQTIEATCGMHLHYAFDNWMSKQSSPFVMVLVMVITIIIFGGWGIFMVCEEEDENLDESGDRRQLKPWRRMNMRREDDEEQCTLLEGMWVAWEYVNDPAAHAGNDPGAVRAVGLVVSMIGLFIFAMLMGFVFDLITLQMTELRKGKSIVVEKDHTLILGWSDKLYTILMELCDANESRPDGTSGGVIVILATPGEGMAPECKDDMIAELDERIDEERRKGTKFVIRVGSPMLASDLAKVACHAARSIIILCDDDGEATRADAAVLRGVVSLGAALPASSPAHVVSQIRDVDCIPLLKLVCSDRVETVVSHDIVGRLMVMSVRQPGLAKVYEALLGFEGDEFYIEAWPQVIGKRFGDLFQHFPDAIPLGIRTEDGTVVMKPHMDRQVYEGEEILVLSEDDDTYTYVEATCDCSPGPSSAEVAPQPEKMLIVGWRRDFRDIIELMNELMCEGSEIHVLCDLEVEKRDEFLEDAGVDFEQLNNLELKHFKGSARRHFEKLKLEEFTSCMIVADEESEDDLMNSDSQCIQKLLLIRDVQMKRKDQDGQSEEAQIKSQRDCPILVETLDPRTQDCIKASTALQSIADFVQSNEMVSRVLAMVSEERSVNVILSELLGGTGAGFELKPAEPYLNNPNEKLTFLQFSKRAQERDEVLVGYQLSPSSIDENTVMNPRDKLVAKEWSGVLMIVLSGKAPYHPNLHQGKASDVQQKALLGVMGVPPSYRDWL